MRKMEVNKMQKTLSAEVNKVSTDRIRVEITRDNYESFCNAIGLYRKDFIETLKKSEADHRTGRTTKRKSLLEIIEKA